MHKQSGTNKFKNKKISDTKLVKAENKVKNKDESETFEELNDKQKQAVSILDKPVLVLAGPGTGKTKLLTTKIAYILQTTDARPQDILALTFTESATANVKKRLVSMIGPAGFDVNVFTFHGFANHLLQIYSTSYFAQYENFRVISDIERVQILKNILSSSKHEFKVLSEKLNPNKFIKKLMDQLEVVKRENLTVKHFEQMLTIEEKVLNSLTKVSKTSTSGLTGKYEKQLEYLNRLQDFYFVYKEYQKYIEEKGLMDFADLLNVVLDKMDTNKEFLQTLQESYQYILVDEYQDTNTAQNRLVFKIAEYWGDSSNITVVGDDDQAIYRFQGASIANLKEFMEKFSSAEPVVLDTNYRSLQSIVDASSDVASNLSDTLAKQLKIKKDFKAFNTTLPQEYANKDLETGVNVHEFVSTLEEYEFIAKKIKELIKKGIKPKNIAILARQNSQFNLLMHVFRNHNINFVKYGGVDIFERPVVLQFLEFLHLIENVDDLKTASVSLLQIVHFKFFNLKADDIVKTRQAFTKFKENYKQNLISSGKRPYDAVKEAENITFLDFLRSVVSGKLEGITPDIAETAKKMYNIFELAVELSLEKYNSNLSTFLFSVFKKIGLADYVLTLPNKVDIISAFSTLFEHAKILVLNEPDVTLKEFLEILDLFPKYNLKLEAYSVYSPDDSVLLLTVHKAKGLEFDYVFVPQAVDRLWENKGGQGGLLSLPNYVFKPEISLEQAVSEQLAKINMSDKDKKALSATKKMLQQDDERRNFYVALTRAKYGAYITGANKILHFSGLVDTNMSKFVTEIQDEHKTYKNHETGADISDDMLLTLLMPNSNDFLSIQLNDLDIVKNTLKNIKYSASMITTFLDSPNDFYLRYILRMPQQPTFALIYGNAFHDVMEKTFKKYIFTNKMPSYEFALEQFEEALAKYPVNTQEFEALMQKAKHELYIYFKSRLENYKYTPISLEKWAKAEFSGYQLHGKIDKIEAVTSKDVLTDYVQIVDYKTGRYVHENEILGKWKSSKLLRGFMTKQAFQLYFYKLLFDLDPNVNENGRYIAKWGVLDFSQVEKGKKFVKPPVQIEFNNETYEEFKQFLLDTINEINSLEWVKKLNN